MCLQGLLIALPSQGDESVQTLSSMAAQRPAAAVSCFNKTSHQLAPATCLHHMFEDQAAQRPDAPCLRYKEVMLSYGRVDALADEVARRLHSGGMTSCRTVGVLLPRSFELYIAMLGVLKAGGTCLMLDSEQPTERHVALHGQLSFQLVLSSEEAARDWPSHCTAQVRITRK